MELETAEWLVSEGGMADRIRAHHWAATPLGPIANWTAPLRAALAMVLDHPLPMALAWGTEFITLYNDAYRPLLGKRADALGLPFLDVWSEARAIIAPMLASTLAGKSRRYETASSTLLGGQSSEAAFFDGSFSPVRDENGAVAGILNTALEMANRVPASNRPTDVSRALQESEVRFRTLATTGSYSMYRMSPDWRTMYQLSSDTLAATDEPTENWTEKYIPSDDLHAVLDAIGQAIQTKSLFELEHRVKLADGSIGWVLSRAVPLLDAAGEISEWFGAGSNVTDRREAAEKLRMHEEEYRIELERQVRAQTTELKASRDLLQATMDSSVDMIQVFQAVRTPSGKIVDFEWVLNNHAAERRYGDVLGQSLLKRNPGVAQQGIFDAFKRVVETGVAEQAERHYVHDDVDGWFYQSVTRLADGVATSTKDISLWKAAQADVLRLQEEVAQGLLRENEEKYRRLFLTMNQGFAECEIVRNDQGHAVDHRLIAMNPAFERLTGVSGEDACGRVANEVFPSLAPWWIEKFDQVVKQDASARLEYREDANGRWYQVDIYPVAGDRFVELHEDITERKRAELVLRESEERQTSLLKLSDALRALDEPSQITGTAMRLLGEWLHANRAYFVIWPPGEDYGEVADDFATSGLGSLAGRYPIDVFRFAYERISQGRTWIVDDAAADVEMGAAEREYYLANGVTAWIDVPLVNWGQIQAALCLVQDVARQWTANEIAIVEETAERCWAAIDRAAAEAAKRASEERLALAFRTLPVGMAIVGAQGELLMSNEHMSRFLPTGKIPSRDRERTERWQAYDRDGHVVAPADFPRARALRGETVSPGLQMIYRDDQGLEVWTEILSAPLRDNRGEINGALSVVIDIDRIKRSEEAARASEERFRLFVENVQEYALVQTSQRGEITNWNPGAERMFGYSSGEIVGRPFSLVLTEEDFHNNVFARELAFVASGKRNEDARWLVRRDGSRFWARWITEPVYEPQGTFLGLAKVMRDETDRRSADEALRASLVEKEELLKEVHHRVKNNLQVIVSLLNLQSGQLESKEVLAQFQEARNRVLAISSIHELLYRAESFAGISLLAYARQLTPGLIRFYALESRVRLELQGDGNKLELERAVPFGMLLNELVSNACKHAFPAPCTGNLLLAIETVGDDLELVVSDNGKGLPDHFDYLRATSLGLKLVHALARQLQGKVQVSSEAGTTVRVRFPKNAVEFRAGS